MEILGALLAGSFIGAVLGFVGAGGAMLSVPILMYLFGFEPKLATTAALAVVFLAALSGVIPKARKKQVLYRDAFAISSIGLITNLGFAFIAQHIPDAVIAMIPDTAAKFQINTPLRLAHFLAQCGHESGGFRLTKENLNYSAKGLNGIFRKSRKKKSNGWRVSEPSKRSTISTPVQTTSLV